MRDLVVLRPTVYCYYNHRNGNYLFFALSFIFINALELQF